MIVLPLGKSLCEAPCVTLVTLTNTTHLWLYTYTRHTQTGCQIYVFPQLAIQFFITSACIDGRTWVFCFDLGEWGSASQNSCTAQLLMMIAFIRHCNISIFHRYCFSRFNLLIGSERLAYYSSKMFCFTWHSLFGKFGWQFMQSSSL